MKTLIFLTFLITFTTPCQLMGESCSLNNKPGICFEKECFAICSTKECEIDYTNCYFVEILFTKRICHNLPEGETALKIEMSKQMQPEEELVEPELNKDGVPNFDDENAKYDYGMDKYYIITILDIKAMKLFVNKEYEEVLNDGVGWEDGRVCGFVDTPKFKNNKIVIGNRCFRNCEKSKTCGQVFDEHCIGVRIKDEDLYEGYKRPFFVCMPDYFYELYKGNYYVNKVGGLFQNCKGVEDGRFCSSLSLVEKVNSYLISDYNHGVCYLGQCYTKCDYRKSCGKYVGNTCFRFTRENPDYNWQIYFLCKGATYAKIKGLLFTPPKTGYLEENVAAPLFTHYKPEQVKPFDLQEYNTQAVYIKNNADEPMPLLLENKISEESFSTSNLLDDGMACKADDKEGNSFIMANKFCLKSCENSKQCKTDPCWSILKKSSDPESPAIPLYICNPRNTISEFFEDYLVKEVEITNNCKLEGIKDGTFCSNIPYVDKANLWLDKQVTHGICIKEYCYSWCRTFDNCDEVSKTCFRLQNNDQALNWEVYFVCKSEIVNFLGRESGYKNLEFNNDQYTPSNWQFLFEGKKYEEKVELREKGRGEYEERMRVIIKKNAINAEVI